MCEKAKQTVYGCPEQPTTWMYRDAVTGVLVREACFDTGRGGKPVEIVQLTDIHFNKLSVADMREHNLSVISTANKRLLCAHGASIHRLHPCLDFAAGCDRLVVTGDTLDYMTHGALAMLKEYIWKPFPDALVALGNHDASRVMGLPGTVDDPTSLADRYAFLQTHWKHDILYTACTLADKVTVVQLDNSRDCFWDSQVPRLTADVADARANGRIVLLFMHSPLCSRNPVENPIKSFGASTHDEVELYRGGVGYAAQGATKAVYDLITHNADVIKGVFCGHQHSNIYSEIFAQTSDGQSAMIPQYVLNGTYSAPYALKITVK